MALTTMATISRRDMQDNGLIVNITDVKHLISYSWIKSSTPIIAVPDIPPKWFPPPVARRLPKDSGLVYIAQDAARHPESPLEPCSVFTINVEVVGSTVFFYRTETKTQELIAPREWKGFGHEFEKATHYWIVLYRFGGLSFIVRYKVDGYIDDINKPTGSKLVIREQGYDMPLGTTLEIKT
ncbi:uncharacterized protein BCR38DRAFT_458239 [Pseudomassariella vexata]|uniref:Uncharacterized protein n=1 Tax=Pseudomassariella vexata TaxID=1141098 RepID=A0A1Y2DV19_9PEZI|nr:uncharacterized protein BCR38DRAFT_458239 [Pseudomassariella vexata]ORY62976.1 hypothetical protein BCR38DRAFT_458239 [Pseudomassariella vexata]